MTCTIVKLSIVIPVAHMKLNHVPENLQSLFGHFSHESQSVRVIISSHDKRLAIIMMLCSSLIFNRGKRFAK